MGVSCWEAEEHKDGNDTTMVKDAWYTYLGKQNIEDTPANPGDNGYHQDGFRFKGNLTFRLAPNETYEMRKSYELNGAWFSQSVDLVVGSTGIVKVEIIEGDGIEIDIRCTSSANGEVRYCMLVEKSTCI